MADEDGDKRGRFPGFDFGGGGSGGPSNGKRRNALWYIIPLVVLGYLLFAGVGGLTRGTSIPYSTLISKVESGDIVSANITPDSVNGVMTEDNKQVNFTTTLPTN